MSRSQSRLSSLVSRLSISPLEARRAAVRGRRLVLLARPLRLALRRRAPLPPAERGHPRRRVRARAAEGGVEGALLRALVAGRKEAAHPRTTAMQSDDGEDMRMPWRTQEGRGGSLPPQQPVAFEGAVELLVGRGLLRELWGLLVGLLEVTATLEVVTTHPCSFSRWSRAAPRVRARRPLRRVRGRRRHRRRRRPRPHEVSAAGARALPTGLGARGDGDDDEPLGIEREIWRFLSCVVRFEGEGERRCGACRRRAKGMPSYPLGSRVEAASKPRTERATQRRRTTSRSCHAPRGLRPAPPAGLGARGGDDDGG